MKLQGIDIQQGVIKFSGAVIDAQNVRISFKTLTGSDPKTQGYFVAVWQSTQILSLDKALTTKKIDHSSQDGSITFPLALEKQNYIIGFGVDSKDGSTVCATISVSANAQPGPLPDATLSTVTVPEDGIDSNSLVAQFRTPLYNKAAANDNWIGLFDGEFTANFFDGSDVIATKKANTETNAGSIFLEGLSLLRFQTYTVVYGMGFEKGKPNYKNIISYYTFTV